MYSSPQSNVLTPATKAPLFSSQTMSGGTLGGDVPRSPRVLSPRDARPIKQVKLVLPEASKIDCECGPDRTSKPLSLKNFMGRVSDTRAEEELMDKGYAIVDKVFTRDNSGNVVCEYIKARTVRGQLVFVEMDSGGCVAYRKDDLTAVRMKDAIKVPHSAKLGALECADLGVCGVAFECKDGICTLVRNCDDSSMEPTEHHLVTVTKQAKESIVMDDNPVAYPVVKMSEIMANSKLVMENIDKVTRKMRKKAFVRCRKNIQENKCVLRDLCREYKVFCDYAGQMFDDLQRSIYELDCLQDPYLECPPECDDNKAKFKLLGYNLRVRYDDMDKLIAHCDIVAAQRCQLEVMTHTIHDMNCWFDNDKPDYCKVMTHCDE